VETDGRQEDEGRDGRDPESNVVLFPRDWFGPKDELVPFGPRASQASVVDLEPPAPVRPDDFWGEGSAAIHDVLQGPGASPQEATPRKVGDGSPSVADLDRERVANRELVAHLYTRARWLGAAMRLPRAPWPKVPRGMRRYVLVAAGCIAALALCAFMVGQFGLTQGGVERAAVRARTQVTSKRDADAVRGRQADEGATSLLLAMHRSSATRWSAAKLRLQRGHGVPRRSSSRLAQKRSSGKRAPADESDAPVASGSSGSGAGESGAGTTTQYVSGDSDGAGDGSAGSGSSGGSETGAASGPVGAGAPFGPGHLG
jgi:hypothetical protein